MRFGKTVITFFLSLPVIVGCSSSLEGSKGAIPYDSSKLNANQLQRILSLYVPLQSRKALTVGSFADEFENNSIVAEEKYTRKAVKLLGKINSVDKNFFDEIDVVLEDPYEMYSFDMVTCSNVTRRTAKTLRKNQVLTVYGYVKENTDFGVELAWCYFGENKGITPQQAIDLIKSKM